MPHKNSIKPFTAADKTSAAYSFSPINSASPTVLVCRRLLSTPIPERAGISNQPRYSRPLIYFLITRNEPPRKLGGSSRRKSERENGSPDEISMISRKLYIYNAERERERGRRAVRGKRTARDENGIENH